MNRQDPPNAIEEWRPVIGYEGLYEVSSMGRVRSYKYGKNKLVKPVEHGHGYLAVFLYRDGVRTKRKLHRLVLESFVGSSPDGWVARHLNGNPSDNRLCNLAWGTSSENAQDRNFHGTNNKPENAADTKLIPSDIPLIRSLAAQGFSSRQIAKRFQTSHTTVQKIIRGERWVGYE